MQIKESEYRKSALEQAFKQNEIQANIQLSYILFLVGAVYIAIWFMMITKRWIPLENIVETTVFLLGVTLALVWVSALCCFKGPHRPWAKYLMSAALVLSVFLINTWSTSPLWLFFAFPLIISVRYFNSSFSLRIAVFTFLMMIISAAVRRGIHPDMAVSDNMVLPNLMIMLLITAVCQLACETGYKMITEQSEAASREAAMETELTDTRTKIMVSQIQPHFLFNALNTIYDLCDRDPHMAQQALDEFSTYLRMNIDSLGNKGMVPFDKELQHTKTYLHLEQLRFEERLNVVYDIKYTNFMIPPLSLQPLVENAVKHGICKKREGGTVTVSTAYDTNAPSVIITISDDGAGFDASSLKSAGAGPEPGTSDLKPDRTGRTHVGLENVKSRLMLMCDADFQLHSQPGEGTVITIKLPVKHTGQ